MKKVEEKAEEPEEVIYQICYVCKERKPLTRFYKDRNRKLGRNSICKQCQAIKNAKYREEHKKEIAEYYMANRESEQKRNREYYCNHKDQKRIYNRKYRLDHKKQLNAKRRQYRKCHKRERREESRKYRKNHKEHRSDYNREYYQTETGRLNHKMCKHRRRARKLAADGDGISAEQWQRILKSQKNKCNLCHKRFTKSRSATMDHIIPLSKGGTHSSVNIQALCGSCNSSKQAKIMKGFITSWDHN